MQKNKYCEKYPTLFYDENSEQTRNKKELPHPVKEYL